MISANNFEMYCMLYADGELSPVEIQELQAFLAANPDWEPAWNRWQQLKLSAPSIHFPHPEQLMQPGTAIISEADAWLYLDGELAAAEKSQIEELLHNNIEARNRIQQLESYKLSADLVACPDKASLYKNEKAPRIIAFRSMIRLAAAAFIGWLLYTYFPYFSKPDATPAVVVTQPNNTHQLHDLPTATPPADLNPVIHANTQTTLSNRHSSLVNSTNPALALVEKIAGNANPNFNPQNNTLSKSETVNSIANNPTPPIETTLENVATQLPEVKAETTSPVQSVVYKELDIQNTRETINIGNMEIREGKVRGIIRRAQALFKNKNSSSPQPADEYKVLPAVQIIQN